MKKTYFKLLALLLLSSLFAGCSLAPPREQGGVTIDDGSFKNVFHALGKAWNNE